MFAKTHKLIANNIINTLPIQYNEYINKKYFIYGNIKPDGFSKYKFIKHYKDESYNLMLSKIIFLKDLSLNDIDKYGIKKFNEELGVLCHFFSDYFCLAHDERWLFKTNMIEHIKYESNLCTLKFDFNIENKESCIKNVEKFLSSELNKYHKLKSVENLNPKNDIIFAQYVCNSIVLFILDSILNKKENTKKFPQNLFVGTSLLYK